MGKLVFDLCMHVAFLLLLYLLPWIPGIIQGLLMGISPITTFLLWLQNKQQKFGREFRRGINVKRLILSKGLFLKCITIIINEDLNILSS